MPEGYTFDELTAPAQPEGYSHDELLQAEPTAYSFDDLTNAADKTFQSQLAVKVPEVIAETGMDFEKHPELSDAENETLNSLKKDIVLKEASKRVNESPIMGVGRGIRDTIIGGAEFARSPEGLGLAALSTVAPTVSAGLLAGLAAKAIGEGSGTLSVPGISNQEVTKQILNMGLMTLAGAQGAKLIPKPTEIPKGEIPNAIQEQNAATEVLRNEKPQPEQQLGLREVGARNAQPEEIARAQEEVPVQAGQTRVLLDPQDPQVNALRQLGLTSEDIIDLKSGNASVPDIVARKLQPFEGGGGPDHAKALEEARMQAIMQIESTLRQIPSVPSGAKGETQLAIFPGAKEFVEQDVIPKTVEGAKGIIETTRGARNLLSAPTASESAGLAAGIIREKAAELARKDVQARKDFADARSEMAKWTPNQSLQFIDKVETGATHMLSPEMQKVAAALRDGYVPRIKGVQKFGRLKNVLDDYFAHIWKQETPLSSVIARIFGKRPLTGTKAFLRHRTIPTTLDGVMAGKEPVTWNPIDLTLLKYHEMDRFIMGQEIMKEFKDKGLVQFSHSDVPPPGMAKINDSIANVIEYRPTKTLSGAPGAPERVLRGHYFAQEDAARVLNNFLAPGLEKFAWYRGLRWIGNTLNMANLGLSGYHLTFTMIDSGTSKLSLGIEQLAQGKAKGAITAARGVAGTVAANQLEAFYKGSKVLQEYSKPGSVGGEYTKVVDALMAGGGRVEMPQMFQNSTLKNFFDAAKSGNYPGAILRAPFAAIHAVSYPLMNVIVPRLKLGIFNDMALHEIERMGPGVTRDQFRKAMGKIWDSVDNRMGEIVYDNLFWNKTLKDLAFLSVRSVGWNLGTVRELGGALVDSSKVISRLKSGDPVVTRKMAYLVALPITVGLMGALYQRLRTGQGPQELKDYFYPKTGNLLPNGEPERVSFPSYLKDVVSVKRHPAQTVINKAHPLPGLVANMLENRDFYGTEIIHPDDPLVQQVKDELAFAVKSFKPYSAQGAQKRTELQPGVEPAVESFFGIMPIPAELTRTDAENLAIKLLRDQMPQGSRTKEQFQKADAENKALTQIKTGRMTIDDAVDKGLVTEERAKAVQERVDTPYLEYAIKHLPAPQAMRVLEKSTAKERELIADMVYGKILRSQSLSDEERDKLLERFDKLEGKK